MKKDKGHKFRASGFGHQVPHARRKDKGKMGDGVDLLCKIVLSEKRKRSETLGHMTDYFLTERAICLVRF
jgi:hypothetical protein